MDNKPKPEAMKVMKEDGDGMRENVPSLAVDFDAGVATISVAVVLVHADVLLDSYAAAFGLATVAVFFGDADVLTRVALGVVVSTGRESLRLLVSAFPSSVLDCDAFFALDLSGLGRCLLVFV